jgi:predicted nucleic acid-binding protein
MCSSWASVAAGSASIESAGFCVIWAAADVALDHSPDEAAVMALARKHRLTVYDASYLELALREGVPLATLDRSLAATATSEGMTAVGG